jgi:hypothetical protein
MDERQKEQNKLLTDVNDQQMNLLADMKDQQEKILNVLVKLNENFNKKLGSESQPTEEKMIYMRTHWTMSNVRRTFC